MILTTSMFCISFHPPMLYVSPIAPFSSTVSRPRAARFRFQPSPARKGQAYHGIQTSF